MASDHPTKATRRGFLQSAAGIGLAAGFPTIIPSSALGRDGATPPSERVRIGHIGVGNQGRGNLKALLKQTVAVCEVDKTRLDEAHKTVETANGGTCAAFGDYRRLLDRKDIDAVVITVPDHWHALITVDACAAGKDVYCEKPLSLTVVEGRAMVEAARRFGRMVQTGSQQRSDDKFRLACELVRNGYLGKIKTIKVGIPGNNFKGPAVADSAPPAELDYNFWLGPASKKPYNEKHVHYNFRFFWDYSGGQMTNFGAHHLDIARWALGRDESGPIKIEGKAKYTPGVDYEMPDWCEVDYTYDDGVIVHCGQDHKGGVTFEGEKGTLFVTRGKIESTPGDILKQVLKNTDTHLQVSKNHHQNWLDSIKSRKLPICDVAIGHRSATVCHLGNIALRTGRTIHWDPTAEKIVGDSDAAKMLSRPYREPWHLPEGTPGHS